MPKRILFLLAHPDDETFGPGGTTAKSARAGGWVPLAPATRGEAGMLGDPPVTDREHLGEVRSAELEEAAGILGVEEVHFLGFGDGQLADVPREHLVERAVEVIRRVRPHVLVGFGPDGVSRHPDHKAMCEVALAAFDRAGDPGWYPGHLRDGAPPWAPLKLYQFEVPQEILAAWDVPLSGVPLAKLTTVIDTSGDAETKLRAFRCHRTQRKDVERILSRPGYREFARQETYVLARTRVDGLTFPEHDLLAGIPED
ncbi:MAG: N-acetylglucosaminyl deacetylase, LmbE family [Deltaproteobacteria bacterium]|nr:N-acetylglucosaminyl deacetylase, LmbE family [Deltaproteobacteria bacterium]